MKPTASRRDERGSALIIALLLTVMLFLLGVALLATAGTESAIAANDHWAEGAFQAAEAAVHVSMDQLDIGQVDQIVPETALGDRFVFRSGGRDDAAPQPPRFVGARPVEGFAVGGSTGYNPSGYMFEQYRINGTGNGPRNTEREVEVQVELGPVEQ